MEVLDFIKTYWNYYIHLENEFFETNDSCAIDTQNRKSYSTKYQHLFLSICSEVDVVCKTICKLINDEFDVNKSGIDDYRSCINKKFQVFFDETITIWGYDIADISPWKSFKYSHNPSWWGDYNKVKHHRDEELNYKKASQENVLSALCGLYIAIQYLAWLFFESDCNGDENPTMGRFCSERLSLKDWIYFAYFNCPAKWLSMSSMKKHFNEEK